MGGKIIPVVNPQILEVSKRKISQKQKGHSILEGCLSLPNYYTPLKRADSVKLKYTTPQGTEKTEVFTGFSAQIVQHEVDHLNGIMFIDRLLEQKKPLYKMENGEWIEVELT
jgi:peptide deformylase